MNKIAVVTGANRGLGFETSRQLAQQGYHVILTSRSIEKGQAAVEKLCQQGLNVTFHPLDVTDQASVEKLAIFLKQQFNRVDVLVNNAGVDLDRQDTNNVLETQIDTLRQTMETNVYGPLRLCQALVPLMKANDYGRIVNVSSILGQFNRMQHSDCPGYRVSKLALNAFTRIIADELRGTNIWVNSVCPGWVQTDLGGINAPRPVEQGVETIVWLATLPEDLKNGGFFHTGLAKVFRKLSQALPERVVSGGFFRDRKPIPW